MGRPTRLGWSVAVVDGERRGLRTLTLSLPVRIENPGFPGTLSRNSEHLLRWRRSPSKCPKRLRSSSGPLRLWRQENDFHGLVVNWCIDGMLDRSS